MTDYAELKRLAAACGDLNWRTIQESWCEWAIRDDHAYIATMRTKSAKHAGPCPDREAKAKFLCAVTPAVVRALIDENERQAAQFKEWQASHHANYCSVADERDQLRAEVAGLKTGYQAYERVNAELKAEVEKLRNSSSCVDDLSALVRQLVHRLRKAAPDNDLPEKALDYLKRKGLQGSPLRNEHDDAAEREAQKIYESWADHDCFVPWVKGGNSLKQDEARRLARAAMGEGDQS